MENNKRQLQIKYPDRYPGDNNWHTVLVYRADLTKDGRVVISYYDLTDNNTDSFSEIINVNGEWLKNPNHLEWQDYDFSDFDLLFSNSTINALRDKIELKKPILSENLKDKIPTIALAENLGVDPPKHKIKFIQMVVFANEDEDIINLKPTTYNSGQLTEQDYSFFACSAFFSQGFLDNNFSEQFKRIEIDDKDKKDIYEYMRKNLSQSDKINVSKSSQFSVEASSNTQYIINASSCSDWSLFTSVKGADSLTIDEKNVSNITFPDYLSAALHYQLPLHMMINGNYHSNGIDKEGRKR